MSLSKRKRRSTQSNEDVILETKHSLDFFSNLNLSKTSTPIKLTTENHIEINLETINHTNPELQELDFRDNESTDSEDSTVFNFDQDCSNGLIDEIDNYNETIDGNNDKNHHSDKNFDNNCNEEVDYVTVRDKLIMIIPKYSTTCFDGLMSVRVLQGEVEVFGYTLNKLSGTKQLYSPRGCSRLYIKNNGNQTNTLQQHGFANWPIKGSSEELNDIFERIKPTDSVLLCQNINSFEIDFLVNHISQQIYPSSGILKCVFEQDYQDENSIRVNPIWDKIIQNINKDSKILLAGGKSVGKSTTLRYMVNKLLMKYTEILVIDLDPGQPEFTVPGCVSASIVTEPLFGPNFTHLRKPARCIFVPDIDLSEDADEYIGFVESLMTQCDTITSLPTIINHMGFTRGLGFYILSAVMVCVQPTTIIHIKSGKSSRNYSDNLCPKSLRENVNKFQKKGLNAFTVPNIITIDSMSDNIYRWNLEPRIIRELCILNYFGTMISRVGMTITDVEKYTYTINTSDVNLMDKEGSISPNVINGNLVALCGSVHNSRCFNCFGWGIVRAINFENQDLYVLTPVALEDLEKVDTLIKGSVTLPPSLFMNTNNVYGLIPYVANGILSKYGELTKRSHIPHAAKRATLDG